MIGFLCTMTDASKLNWVKFQWPPEPADYNNTGAI